MEAARPGRARRRGRLGRDAAVAGLAALVSGTAYAASFHPDWWSDPLQDATWIQRDALGSLLGPQHVLGALLPLGSFRLAVALGYEGRAMPFLAALNLMGAAAAVAVAFLVARRLGVPRPAAATAAAFLGATAALWRAGGTGGAYGIAHASIAIAWLMIARQASDPSGGRAFFAGAAVGVAVDCHLASLALIPAALPVAFSGPEGHRRTLANPALFALGVASTVLPVFSLAAGLATRFSPPEMLDWFLHPGIGGATDQSAMIGWGIGGLLHAVAGRGPALARAAITAGLVVLALAGGRALVSRGGWGRLVGLALMLHAAGAFLLASWFQSLRADYWGLGFIPTAVLGAAGSVAVARRLPTIARRLSPAVAAVAAAGLATWTLTTEVRPSLERSHWNAVATSAIAREVPGDAHVIASLFVSSRLAERGIRAENAWGALRRAVTAGAPRPGVGALAEEAHRVPVYVSRKAFDTMLPTQAAWLGSSADRIWSRLERRARLQRVLRVRTGFGPETLYRLVVAP